MTNVETWGVGCQMCAYTGEGWLHGTLGGDGVDRGAYRYNHIRLP